MDSHLGQDFRRRRVVLQPLKMGEHAFAVAKHRFPSSPDGLLARADVADNAIGAVLAGLLALAYAVLAVKVRRA